MQAYPSTLCTNSTTSVLDNLSENVKFSWQNLYIHVDSKYFDSVLNSMRTNQQCEDICMELRYLSSN